MNLIAGRITKILPANQRVYMLIGNLSDTTIYLSRTEFADKEDYTQNSFALKHNGLLEINPCIYQGSMYAYTDETSDVRVLEL